MKCIIIFIIFTQSIADIIYLNIVRLNPEVSCNLTIHTARLKCPSGTLLIKQRPEYWKRKHHEWDIPHRLHILHKLLSKLCFSPVQPVTLSSLLLWSQAWLNNNEWIRFSVLLHQSHPDTSQCLLDQILLAPVWHTQLVEVEDSAEKEEGDSNKHEDGWNTKS